MPKAEAPAAREPVRRRGIAPHRPLVFFRLPSAGAWLAPLPAFSPIMPRTFLDGSLVVS